MRWKIEILRDRTNRPSHVEINAIPEHLSACWHQTTRNIVRLYTFLDWCETAELAEQIVRARKIAFDMRERTESRVLFVGVVNQNYMWNVDITLLDNDTLVSTVDKCSLLAIELCPVCAEVCEASGAGRRWITVTDKSKGLKVSAAVDAAGVYWRFFRVKDNGNGGLLVSTSRSADHEHLFCRVLSALSAQGRV